MRPEDELSGVICKECYTLISELIDFAEHVNKVQAIFEVLRRSEPNKMLDVEALRRQYALQNGDWTHIIKPVSDIDNSLSEQTIFAEDFPVEMLVPKQEFLNSTQELEDEQQNPLDHCEEPIVTQAPTEEIIVERCDAKARSQKSPVKRSRGRPRKYSIYDKQVSDINEDLPNNSASQVLPRSDTAEPEVHETSSSLECDNNELKSTKRRKLKCKWCSKLYHNPKSYEKHLKLGCRKVEPRTKVDKNKFCKICNKTLSSAAAFKLHMEGMHNNVKPYVCDHCGKQLKSLTALNEHQLVHTESRPFKCTVCDAGFKNNTQLKVHSQIHEEPNYICNICGKKLQTRRTWNMHKLVHNEERKFKCDVCCALFKRSKTLKTHLLIHAGMRPYVCKYCGQTFSCNANCRAHKMKKHPKELMEEENEDLPTRMNVPSLEELRIM